MAMFSAAAMVIAASLAVPAGPRHPSWSPDGRWIAYDDACVIEHVHRCDIWKTDGVRFQRIVRGGYDPASSPDGARIAFSGSDMHVRVVGAAGGVSRSVSPRSSYDPSWSPDGRSLVYSGFPPEGVCGDGFGLYAQERDGAHRREVLHGDEFEEYYAPAWSPHGTLIAFLHGDGGDALDTIPARGGVTHEFPPGNLRPGRPSWSPDGRFLVFSDDRTSPPGYYPPEGFGPMYVLEVRTGKLRRLGRMWGNGPAWSPGGKRIAFAGPPVDGKTRIFLVDPDGSHLTPLRSRA